jgi:hypothetical protein
MTSLENANFDHLMSYDEIDFEAFPSLLDDMLGWTGSEGG